MTLPRIDEITKHFPKHRESVVKNLLIASASIFESETTNLNKVKKKVSHVTGNKETHPESNYKRLTRLFNVEKKKELVKGLLCLCCCLLDSRFGIKYLALDGTSWEYGEKKIHLLTLSVVYSGISIPIWWEELDKKGTSNFKERKRVFREACKYLNLEGLILLADREYIGRDWFKYLKNKKIGFVIRLKKSIYKEEVDALGMGGSDSDSIRKARYIKLERMAKFHRYSKYGVSKRIRISGYEFTFVVFKNPKPTAKEKLLYFISSIKDKKEITRAYPIRWTIETCFKHLKSNGFRLEELGMKNSEKIKLMMGIVVFL